ncbi:MAG: TetR/AcrR family transcriptional regulator [Jatrophihabitantaceae bacterium]
MRVDPPDNVRRPRSDALRNRAELLSRAVELIAEYGPTVPLDDIARAAGVGSATLYRHFPDRAALLQAIAAQVIGASAQAAERALAEEPDSYAALARYLREALRVRVAWVMPAIAAAIDHDDEHLAGLRTRSVTAISTMIADAQRDGVIRPDLTFGDVSLLLLRLARPLPQGGDREAQDATAARHLAIVLAGLRPDAEILPATGLELADLRRQRPTPFVATRPEETA